VFHDTKLVTEFPSLAAYNPTRHIMEEGTGRKSSKLSTYLLRGVSILNYDKAQRDVP
jgi:hypothetical protein